MLNQDQLDCIEEYAEQTGQDPDGCIWQALDDYIRTTVRAATQTEVMNIVGFPEVV